MFNNFLNNCNLLDPGFNGPRFTWSNKTDSNLVMPLIESPITLFGKPFLKRPMSFISQKLPLTIPILINNSPSSHSFNQISYCEGNHCVDLLAKEGSLSNYFVVFHSNPPSSILYQLLVDAWGIVYPKFCNS